MMQLQNAGCHCRCSPGKASFHSYFYLVRVNPVLLNRTKKLIKGLGYRPLDLLRVNKVNNMGYDLA